MFNDPGLARVTRPPPREGRTLAFLTALALIAVLYIGREVFVPVALAVLLSFVLSPVLLVLRRLRIPRTMAVAGVVLLTFVGLVAIGGIVATQVGQLANDLPRYQANVRDKIRDLKGAASGSATMERVAGMLQDLSTELDRPQPQQRLDATGPSQRPIPVEVRAPELGTLAMLRSLVEPMLHPLAITGIIFIFLIFILLQREDLRNRFIRLAGAHDIQRTTAALDDAGARLSRFLLTQVVLNAGSGCVIGAGLGLIGVPGAILWGLLAAVLRFVPYAGAAIAALLPCALALAVDPGWSMVLWSIALFAVVEPVVGHIIEPLLYGRSTGLSPVAVIASATFWTWLWGPIGLVLATPLTLCLVVLGRHVDQLEFLDVMLGDRPPLSAPELFYQRMLAGDPVEASNTAEEFLKEQPLCSYVDEVALPALRLAQVDAERGALDAERIDRIRLSVQELVFNLAPAEEDTDHSANGPVTDERSPLPEQLAVLAGRPTPERPILCIGARTGLDEAAAMLAAMVLTAQGLPARAEGPSGLLRGNIAVLEAGALSIVLISALDSGSTSLLRYSVRRLRRLLPHVPVLLGAWGLVEDRALRTALEEHGDPVATRVCDALSAARRLLPAGPEAAGAADALPRPGRVPAPG